MSDTSSVIIWWLTILVIGCIFFPITSIIFHRFADRGYIFSKTIGIFLSSYLIWLLGSARILPFAKISIIITLIGWTILNFFLYQKYKDDHTPRKKLFPLIIFEEILFLTALAFWSFVRANEPSIRGLEKFMDYGFVNSILRSNFFPPLDMWLAKSPDYTGGYFINYYYFGHYINAFLTKLSGIDSAITYNLMMATLFAFTLMLSFSIGMNLYYLYIQTKLSLEQAKSKIINKYAEMAGLFSSISVGILAAFIVTLGGNLHTIYSFTGNYPVENPRPFWELSAGFYPERYWYPNATRFIPFTIHEFPIYSFVVADLHGHVSDIPFVFLTIAILITLIIRVIPNHKKVVKSADSQRNSPVINFIAEFENHTSLPFSHIVFLGVLLSVMYMTNAWDGLIYMILTVLTFFYINLKRYWQDQTISFFTAIYKTFSASLFLVFFFLIANLPFTLNFKPFVSGIGVLCAPVFLLGKKIGPLVFEAGKCQKSPIWMLSILWGFFYFNVFGFLIYIFIPKVRSKFYKNSIDSSSNQSGNIVSGFFQTHIQVLRDLNPLDVFVTLMIFISTLLLIFPEFFYMKDIYPAHYRANTMFKLGYQAFMMLGLVSGYIVFRIKNKYAGMRKKPGYFIYQAVFIIFFALIGIYPYFAINSYYGSLKSYKGLYGLNWLATQYPDDYKAIEWLRINISCTDGSLDCNNQPVIVEANGDSYTDYDRVSANTGLPTIVGWPVHEWLWRGSYDEAGRRIPEVTAIYESKDLDATKEILKKYNAQYIFVGQLEKDKYKNLNTEKIAKLGKVVFESGGTKIYKVML